MKLTASQVIESILECRHRWKDNEWDTKALDETIERLQVQALDGTQGTRTTGKAATMTRSEQKKFVRELCFNVMHSILVKKLPEEWDGHELRRYIADKFDECAGTVGGKSPYGMRML